MVVQHRIHLAFSTFTRFLVKNQSLQEHQSNLQLRTFNTLQHFTRLFPKDLLQHMPGIDLSRFPRYHGTFAWSWWTCWFAEIAAKESNPELAQERFARWIRCSEPRSKLPAIDSFKELVFGGIYSLKIEWCHTRAQTFHKLRASSCTRKLRASPKSRR